MALIDGEFSSIGDAFVLQLDPIFKVASHNFFQDVVTGETGSRFFTKEFRYSRDTVMYTSWTTLSDAALQAIPSDLTRPYYFEIRYTRAGADTSGTLEWNYFYLDVTVNESFNNTFYPLIFTTPNVFGDFKTDNIDFVVLCANLTDKIMKYGIVPLYISDEDTKERTEDYYEFWKPICCFFALHFILAKQFADIFTTRNLLIDFLTQRGLFLCGKEDLADIQALATNYYDEIRKRGTVEAIPEIKRLICFEDCDEFVYVFVPQYQGGWVLNASSPLWRGNQGIIPMNKMVSQGDDVEDKANFHLVNEADIDLITDTKNNGEDVEVLHIDDVTSQTGILRQGASELKVSVTSGLNYEVRFLVKQELLGDMITFGVTGFDCDGNEINQPFANIETGANQKNFFTKRSMAQTSKYVEVRGILFNESEPTRTGQDAKLNTGYGNHLRFKDDQVKYIYPKIVVEDGATYPGNSTKIYGVRVAVVSNDYSLGFIGLSGYIISYMKIDNPQFTIQQVKDKIARYLMPANSTSAIQAI